MTRSRRRMVAAWQQPSRIQPKRATWSMENNLGPCVTRSHHTTGPPAVSLNFGFDRVGDGVLNGRVGRLGMTRQFSDLVMGGATAVQTTRRLDVGWPWKTAGAFAEVLCGHGHCAPDALRAVGNRILTRLAKTMLGTEAVCADRLRLDAVAAVCEISG